MDGVGVRVKHDDRERKGLEVLFILDVFIDAKNCLESSAGRRLEQDAVAERFPAHFARGLNGVADQMALEASIYVVVKEQLHSRSRSSSNPWAASSKAASACSRSTPSKPSRKPSNV